jgi:DNA-binding NtrC family response regulator
MYKILIVEDEEIIRNALKKLLQKHDYAVAEAGSIEQAKQYRFRDFDLIISDQRLPGGQGTDLIALAPHTPVLIMTSYASMRSAVDAMKLGAVDYIAKPFDHKEMIEAVARLLTASLSRPARPIDTQQPRVIPEVTPQAVTAMEPSPMAATDKSLDNYFIEFVQSHETTLSETAIAEKLGISRKNLWERRQKLGIPRKK